MLAVMAAESVSKYQIILVIGIGIWKYYFGL